jgi:RNA polymerase sigma factor (sigma-70 family)
MTDGELLGCFIEHRDEAAFAALVRRHGPMVWGVCRRVLRHFHDTEDAFQATFLVLFRKASSVLPREMVANWLYGVARQTALKARSVAFRRKEWERQVTDMPEPALESDRRGDLWPLLDQELSHLPDKYRAVVVLCDLQGETRKEAAQQLGCPEGTVASRLATARTMLAKRLARHGLAVSGGTLAALLSQNAAPACAPSSVVSSAINTATLFAPGQVAPPGAISPTAAALAEGVLRTMWLTKGKIGTAVLLMAAVVGMGAAGLFYHAGPGGQAVARPEAEPGGVPNPPTGTATTRKLDSRVDFAVWGPDGKRMATLSIRPGKEGIAGFAAVKTWDVRTGKLEHSFGERALVNTRNAAIVFSPDGQTIAYCALVVKDYKRSGGFLGGFLARPKSAQELLLWDVRKGELKRTIRMGYSGTLPTFAFAPDGKTLAVSWGIDSSGRLASGARLFDTETGEESKAFIGHQGGLVIAVAFSPDGKSLATGGDANDRTIRLWDVQTAQEIRALEGVTGGSRCLAFSPDGKLLASGGDEGVRLWDARTGQSKQFLKEAGPTNAIIFSPDGKLLATAASTWKGDKATGQVKVWDAKTGKSLRTWGDTSFESIAFTPDSQGLYVLLGDKQTVKVLNAKKEGSDEARKEESKSKPPR